MEGKQKRDCSTCAHLGQHLGGQPCYACVRLMDESPFSLWEPAVADENCRTCLWKARADHEMCNVCLRGAELRGTRFGHWVRHEY